MPLAITNLSITLGSMGKEVIISDNQFSPVASEDLVTFNGTPAQVTSASVYAQTVTVPARATSGKVINRKKRETLTGSQQSILRHYTATGPIGRNAYSGYPESIQIGIGNIKLRYRRANLIH